MLYYDPLLPTNTSGSGLTIEFWFTFDGVTENCTLLTIYGPPTAFKAPARSGNGALGYVLINGPSSTISVHGPANAVFTFPVVLNANNPQQIVLVMTTGNGDTNVYFNGLLQGSVILGVADTFYAVNLGPGRYSYDADNAYSYEAYNYTAAHLAIYSYQLTPLRIAAHYSTGFTGSAGVSAAQRFAQILTWATLGLKRGYYWWQGATGNPEITQIGSAYALNGSSAADAINGLEQAESGHSYAQANGSYVYLERWGTYNLELAGDFRGHSCPCWRGGVHPEHVQRRDCRLDDDERDPVLLPGAGVLRHRVRAADSCWRGGAVRADELPVVHRLPGRHVSRRGVGVLGVRVGHHPDRMRLVRR